MFFFVDFVIYVVSFFGIFDVVFSLRQVTKTEGLVSSAGPRGRITSKTKKAQASNPSFFDAENV